MEKYNKLLAGIILINCTMAFAEEIPLSSADTTFTATITEGSCDWLWNETVLNFPPVTLEQVKPETTLIIKPLTVFIQCTQPLMPQLKVTGHTPYGNNEQSVFIDGTNLHNIGFMLQPDDGSQNMPTLSSFYSNGVAGKALVNNIPFSLSSINDTHQVQQIIWVGLVGIGAGATTFPGKFSASLTFTGLIP